MSIRFLRSAAVYAVLGLGLGIYMAASQQFSLRPVHAHALLGGWLSMAVMGLIYKAFPAMNDRFLAPAHFWLHNLGLPVMLVGVAAIHSGRADSGEPLAGVGSVLFAFGVVAFTVNLWRNATTRT